MSSQKIKLTKGKYALVDVEDYEYLSQWKWHYHHNGYAVRNYVRADGHRRITPMHRAVITPQPGKFVDHINGDKLDNRRSNLRICTTSQNAANTKKSSRPLTSQYKGAHWSKLHGRWRAKIVLNQRDRNIGLFDKEHHAAMAYDIWAKELFGEYAQTNFHAV